MVRAWEQKIYRAYIVAVIACCFPKVAPRGLIFGVFSQAVSGTAAYRRALSLFSEGRASSIAQDRTDMLLLKVAQVGGGPYDGYILLFTLCLRWCILFVIMEFECSVPHFAKTNNSFSATPPTI